MVDVNLNTALHSVHTHWSVRDAGIMVMDGPYTLPQYLVAFNYHEFWQRIS